MVNNRLDRLCANILRKRFMTIYCSGRFSQREDKIILHLKISMGNQMVTSEIRK